MLSHYDAVLWETGNDIIARPQEVGGTTLKRRWRYRAVGKDYLNVEGAAKRFVSEQVAHSPWRPTMHLLPKAVQPSGSRNQPGAYCLPVLNDFQQYWLGAYTYIDNGGTAADGSAYPLTGIADPSPGGTPRSTRARTTPRRSCRGRASCRRRTSPWFGPSSAPVDGTGRAPRLRAAHAETGICSVTRPTSRTSG